MPAITTIKLRRGTAAQWTSANPVLSAGEMGVETDTRRSKIGDGTTAWTSLGYTVGDSSGIGTVEWNSVQNKPATFAPSAHAASHASAGADAITIAQSQVTNLTTDLANKAATAHTHVMADITNLTFPPSTTLSDTAPASPVAGARWIKTTTMQEYVYFDSFWVEI
jgi:hypothetical protein